MNFEYVFVWMDNSYVDIYLLILILCKYMYCCVIFFIFFLVKYWIYNILIDNIDIEILYIFDKLKIY